jgi:hypothetical protein
MTKHPSISENSQTNGAQPSDANPDDAVDYRRPPGQEKTDGERLADSDRGISPALPTKNSNNLSECDSWLVANDEGSDRPNVPAPAKSSKDKVDRGRLPNGQWPPGVSGNPKGRKPKNPPNDLDAPSALEQALDKKAKVKYGGKERTLTKRTAILEQWVNQAAKGDHRALRLLIAYADKHSIDLFAGQHRAIRDGFAEAGRTSSGFTLTEDVLDRLSEGALNELTRIVTELEAEKKKKLH